jgi:hypothetical protein
LEGAEDNAHLMKVAPELLVALRDSIFVMEAYFKLAPRQITAMGSSKFTDHMRCLTILEKAYTIIAKAVQ